MKRNSLKRFPAQNVGQHGFTGARRRSSSCSGSGRRWSTHGGWWVWSRGSEAAPRMHVSIFPAKNKSSSPPKWWRLGGDGATVTSQPTRRRGNPQGSTEGASGSAPVCWPQRPSHDTGHRRLAHFPEPPFSQKCPLYSACYKDIYKSLQFTSLLNLRTETLRDRPAVPTVIKGPST